MFRKVVLTCAVAVFGAALSRAEETTAPPIAAPRPDRAKNLYQRTLKSTAFVVVKTAAGSQTGTGWVADRDQRLLITNQHVVRGGQKIVVFFPRYHNGRVLTDPGEYDETNTGIKATVVIGDEKKDLAVLKLESLPTGVSALELADEGSTPGERIHSIGNPGAARSLWIYSQGTVRGAARLRDLGKDIDTILSDLKLNPGDSGGPAVDNDGKLVGVNVAINLAGQGLNYTIDVGEVRLVLDLARRRDNPCSAEDFVRRGDQFKAAGDLKKALADYTQAIDRDATILEAYTSRAWLYNDLNDFDKAIADCSEALKIDANSTDGLRERAFAYLKTKAYQKSAADLRKVVKLNRKDSTAWNYLGQVTEAQGDKARAYIYYGFALETATDNDPQLEKKYLELKKQIAENE